MNASPTLRVRHPYRQLWFPAALILLAGCFTEQRVVWSPDGERAAILAGDGLRLCDPQGNLSQVLVSNVTCVAWSSDSRQLAIGGQEECDSWSQLSALLRPEARDVLRSQAAQLLAQLRSAKPKDVLTSRKSKGENDLNAQLLCLRDTDSSAAAILTTALPAADLKTNPSVRIGTLITAKLTTNGLDLGPRLAAELGSVASIRLSADNHHIAFTLDAANGQLWVASALNEQPARRISSCASLYPDWAPDGKSLLYIAAVRQGSDAEDATVDDALALASLTRQRVIDDFGNIVSTYGKEELTGMLFNNQARVRCLRDGRILFASEKWALPAATKDLPRRQQLFSLDPTRQSTLTELVPLSVQEDLPASLSTFEVSPDDKQIAIAGDNSTVAVFTLVTGDVTVLQPNNPEVELKSIPSWRPPNQLCYLALQASGTNKPKAEVTLWQPGKTNSLSRHWPAASRQGWLD